MKKKLSAVAALGCAAFAAFFSIACQPRQEATRPKAEVPVAEAVAAPSVTPSESAPVAEAARPAESLRMEEFEEEQDFSRFSRAMQVRPKKIKQPKFEGP